MGMFSLIGKILKWIWRVVSSPLRALLQTPGQRKLRKYQALVPGILALQTKFAAMSDSELKEFSAGLRQRAREGETEDALLPEAFAVVREASRRVIGLEHFPEQLLGGIALYYGNITEMKTGEGKTLVATCPLYLNAVMGHRGHLVTVNDYLAKRDRAWMGPVYEFLGMSVGLLQNDSSPEERSAAYAADITYGTNNEFGFDYLRDHMASSEDGVFQKGALDFAIVDEVDNIFIDEARTALIIAGPSEESTTYYFEAARIAAQLKGPQRSNRPVPQTSTKPVPQTSTEPVPQTSREAQKTKKAPIHYVVQILLSIVFFVAGTVLTARTKPRNLGWLVAGCILVLAIWAKDIFGIRDQRLHDEFDTTPETVSSEEEPSEGVDYTIDEKSKSVVLKDAGLRRVERAFHVTNLTDPENLKYMSYINQALRAKEFFDDNSEYIIKDTEVIIVDEFTGRLMYGRRYSDGLHQAIEAKEGLKVREESQTLATITIQNFFKMYHKLSGMTGTALTEADEFKEIYGRDVLEIPPHRTVVRKDLDDEVYRSERGKQAAILLEIQARHEKGQPVLVGTRSVEKSEVLSHELKKLGIKHQVLNAKYHEKEAEIIAQAGRKGSVTIATNMAGRGVDIVLGGNPAALAQAAAIAHTKADPEKQPEQYAELYAKLFAEYSGSWAKEHDEVVSLGGLFILGTERHESRRIDNQLRGRSGRQGDPGESKFFLSAEDDILRIFGGDRIQRIFEMMKVEESMPVNHPLLSKTIEMSQKKVESYNFDARKSLLDYDNVLNKQREVIYAERDKVLAGVDLTDEVHEFINEQAQTTAQQVVQAQRADESDLGKVYNSLVLDAFGRPIAMTLEELTDLVEHRDAEQALTTTIQDRAEAVYREKYNRYGENVMHQIEHYFFLHTVDSAWKEHLLQMDELKEGIGLRAYGQQDPVIAYQKEGYDLFNEVMDQIKHDVTRALFTFELQPPQPEKKHDRS